MTRQNYIPCADEIPVNVIIPVWDFCNHANNKVSIEIGVYAGLFSWYPDLFLNPIFQIAILPNDFLHEKNLSNLIFRITIFQNNLLIDISFPEFMIF